MSDTIQFKRASLGGTPPTVPLAAGEPAFDLTGVTLYVGDGTNNWSFKPLETDLGITAPTLAGRNDLAYSSDADITRVAVVNATPMGLVAFSLYGYDNLSSALGEMGRMQYNSNPAGANIFFTTITPIPFFIGTNNTIGLSMDGTTQAVKIDNGSTGALQIPHMPTGDPADGTGTLWVDGSGVVHLGT
jgi:hypothetical protein